MGRLLFVYRVCVRSLFCNAVFSVLSSFAIISLRKRELNCKKLLYVLAVVWLLVYTVPLPHGALGCMSLQCLIVAFSGLTAS